MTVTATQGAVVHTAALNVLVNDFSMKVTPAKATVVRGKQVRFTVKLTPTGSFTGPVTLSVAGLRARTIRSLHAQPGAGFRLADGHDHDVELPTPGDCKLCVYRASADR